MLPKRILVIDDSPLVLEMASDALMDAGFSVYTASDGIKANQYIFGEDEPDLILLDVMMPLLEGDELARILKKTEYTEAIPVILMSSKPEEELRALASGAGAAGYLCKPFTDDELILKVRTILT